MVTIRKGVLNKIGFTVRELAICEDPMTFKFVFISEDSKGVKYEITMSPVNLGERLQVFHLTEGMDLTFELEGYYSYEIYQTTSDNLVETGLIRVEGEALETQELTNAINPQVYGGGN